MCSYIWINYTHTHLQTRFTILPVGKPKIFLGLSLKIVKQRAKEQVLDKEPIN